MLGSKRRALLSLALLPLSLACSNNVAPKEDDAPPVLDAAVSGIVIDESFEVVGGMRVCAIDEPEIPCTTTDALGKYTLAVPSQTRLTLSYEKDGFVPKLWPVDTGETGFFSFWNMQRRSWYDAQAAALGVSFDSSLGIVSLQVNGEAGVTFRIDPPLGNGPFYTDAKLAADPALLWTSDSGVGAFLNVPPGVYAASFLHPYAACAAKGEETSANEVVVRAGYLTHVSAECE